MTDISMINRAIMRIPRRAEMTDTALLERTFVDLGSLSLVMESRDHQVLYGRRGTGKTHALVHLSALAERSGDLPVYVDMRMTGDAGFYGDTRRSVAQRGTGLLVDMLERLHEALFTWVVEHSADSSGLANAIDSLAAAITQVEVVGEVEHDAATDHSAESESGVEGSLDLHGGIGLRLRERRGERRSSTTRVRRSGVERHQVLFGEVGRALREFTDAIAPRRLCVLIDEWSSVPLELQPLVAELLRKSLFPAAGVTVKIAAIEKRSRFTTLKEDGDFLGIEVGSDVAAGLNLDDLLTEEDGSAATKAFLAEMLWRHVSNYVDDETPSVAGATSGSFVQKAFRKGAFSEFVRAAQGVPRDAINVAALSAQRAGPKPISVLDVRLSARDWYIRDKLANLSKNRRAQELLKRIVNVVLADRPNRCFLIDSVRDANDPLLQDLYDARLIHVLRRGHVIADDPGTLHDLYIVDYGYFVCHLGDGIRGGIAVPQPTLRWANRSSVINLRRLMRDE
jgi:hypothetical protein